MAIKVMVDLSERRQKRQGEAVRDSIIALANKRKMDEQRSAGQEPTGISEETLGVLEKIKGSPKEILSAAKDLGLDFSQEVKPTAERIREVAESVPGTKVSGEIAGGLKVSAEVPDFEQLKTQKQVELDLELEKQAALDEQEFKSSAKSFERGGKLRDDFVKSSDDFVKVRDAFAKINSAAETPSAAGDLAMIFNFMKLLDPGSTVREGEQATARNARGVPEAVTSVYNRLLRGESLGANQRQDFLSQSRKIFQSQVDIHKGRVSAFTQLAKRAEVDPRDVILDLTVPEEFRDQTVEVDDLFAGIS